MKTFRDNLGREWAIAVNVAAVRAVRKALDIDLGSMVGDDGLKNLAALCRDVVALVDVIFVLLKPQADERKVSDEDFGRAMAGDAIGHAADAFVDALADYQPDPKVRDAVRRVVAVGREMQVIMLERLGARLDKLDARAAVAEMLEKERNGTPDAG